jgi:hypothetical protein
MNLIKQKLKATHFEKQNSEFGFENKKVQNPARIPPQTPPAGGKKAEAGQFLFPRKIVCPAESKLVFRIFVKKSSDFVQKVPPIYKFFIFGRDCLAASPLGRRAKRARARFCEDLPRSAWRKGNGLVLDLEVRSGEAQSKMKFCNQSFFVSPLAKLGSDNF